MKPFLPCLLLLLTSPAASQAVLRVNAAGGADFITIGDAVSSASPGDVILVAGGDYDEIVTIDDSLSLHAEGPLPPRVWRIAVQNLPASASVAVRGFETGDVRITNAAGRVRLHDLTIDTAFAFFALDPVVVDDSADVVFDSCTIDPIGHPTFVATVLFTNSKLLLFHCQVAGTDGGSGALPGDEIDGVPAIQVSNSELYLQGGSVIGGSAVVPRGSAAPAISSSGAGSLVRLHDADVQGGSESDGTQVPPFDLSGGTLVNFPTSAKQLAIPSPLREGDLASITLEGEPTDLYWVFLRTPRPALFAGFFDGPLLIQPGGTLLAAGSLPASGTLTLQQVVGDLPVSLPGRPFTLQAFFLEAGRVVMGPTESVVVLDQNFP